ncbi:hypothetical protein J5N97_012712 [Dioscorea zingiberensis]|uniref:Uncharacterized protein n=1 Tax=Dioscorea zingiberensis TaxID=325984 RepID=A0A9D5HI39_9LILI|nr:hypothetical protein J5N97_012712 [Dioscorea zingiberensis]
MFDMHRFLQGLKVMMQTSNQKWTSLEFSRGRYLSFGHLISVVHDLSRAMMVEGITSSFTFISIRDAGSRPSTWTTYWPPVVGDTLFTSKLRRNFLKIMEAETSGTINNPFVCPSLPFEVSKSLFIKALTFKPGCAIEANKVFHLKIVIYPFIIQEQLRLKTFKDHVLVVEQYSHLP